MPPQQQALLQGLGLFIQKFGTKIDMGYELHVSNEKLVSVPPEAQIQVENGPTGVFLRYFPNKTILGELVDGGRDEPAETTAADE